MKIVLNQFIGNSTSAKFENEKFDFSLSAIKYTKLLQIEFRTTKFPDIVKLVFQ